MVQEPKRKIKSSNMQLFVAVLALSVALVQSVPVGPGQESTAQIVSQETETNFDGSFKNSFQTANGIALQETGYVKPGAAGELVQVIQGASAYTAPDGSSIQTQYVADENGYQPSGAHLPTPPPADPVILKSLEYLASIPSTPEPASVYKKY